MSKVSAAEHTAMGRRYGRPQPKGRVYKCGGYAAYDGHCGAPDCSTCHPGSAQAYVDHENGDCEPGDCAAPYCENNPECETEEE